MSTTLTIDDEIYKKLKSISHRTGQPFKTVVNQALRAGISKNRIASQARPYRTRPVSMGEVLGAHSLDQALRFADLLENDELVLKMQLRK